MAHKVTMSTVKQKVSKEDIVFSIKKGNRKLGELRISKGNLTWVTGNGRVQNYITWEDFNLVMTKGGNIK
jgi:hypothetical protein